MNVAIDWDFYFEGPHDKRASILRSTLGAPLCMETPRGYYLVVMELALPVCVFRA